MNKRVVYTTLFGFGQGRLLEPARIEKDIDYICFTDQDLKSKTWRVVRCEPTNDDPCRAAKVYKMLPHVHLEVYEDSAYIDADYRIIGDMNEMMDRYLTRAPFALYKHPIRQCVYKEAQACITLEKDDPATIKRQVDRYRDEGYPKEAGLGACMVLLRKHHYPNVKEFDKAWWKEVREESRRDQIAWPYVQSKTGLPYVFMEENTRHNKYLVWTKCLTRKDMMWHMRAYWKQRGTQGSDISDQLELIYDEVVRLRAKKVLEAGVRLGESTRAILSALSLTNGRLASVDVMEYPGVKKLVAKMGLAKRWSFTKMDSLKYGHDLLKKKKQFDLIFIDTSHAYRQSKRELDLYNKLLARGGSMLLHDTVSKREVAMAIRHFIRENDGWKLEEMGGKNGLGKLTRV